MVNLTVIILTFNEEINIPHSISNVVGWAKDVFILDSGSKDRTCEIAESLGAMVFLNKFETYAKQRNYAIKKLPIETEWTFFLDADEYLTEELKKEIEETLVRTEYDGFYIKRRFYFMGRWIKYGGYYPTWLLRLFKKDTAIIERDINEHVRVSGRVGNLRNDFVDDNKKGVTDWIEKHNKYATFEAKELLNHEKLKVGCKEKRLINGERNGIANLFGSQAQRKMWIREYIWNPLMPPLIRPFIYFFYRYFFRLGFLDGKEGLIYHFLQGLWFVFLIDVKYLEMRGNGGRLNGKSLDRKDVKE